MRKGSKNRMMSLLLELFKDSKRSDRKLSKVLGVSQPTITRMRSRLVREGWIREFTVIPDFVKMGYEIMVISSFKAKRGLKGTTERAIEWTNSKPNIVFAAGAQGMGKNAVLISMHKSYTDYYNFLEEIMAEGEDIVQSHDALIVSLEGKIIKPFSLKYLAEVKETSEED